MGRKHAVETTVIRSIRTQPALALSQQLCAKCAMSLSTSSTKPLVLVKETAGRAAMPTSNKTVALDNTAQLISKLTGCPVASINSDWSVDAHRTHHHTMSRVTKAVQRMANTRTVAFHATHVSRATAAILTLNVFPKSLSVLST